MCIRDRLNVCLVKVPEKEKEAWRHANYKKYEHNPLLAKCDTQDMNYACLTCTHFVGAHFVGAIQAYGVKAVIYSEGLWYDEAARRHLMYTSNCDIG